MAESSRAGYFNALRRLLATLVETGRTRLELIAIELEEEKLRVVDLLASTLGAVFFLGLGIVLFICFLAVAFWEQRLWVFGASAALTLLIGLVLILRSRRLTASPRKLFAGSVTELEKDIAALKALTAGRR